MSNSLPRHSKRNSIKEQSWWVVANKYIDDGWADSRRHIRVFDPVFTYIIGHIPSGNEGVYRVKVGKSGNPISRLASLQSGNPDRLQIIALAGRDIEFELHRYLWRKRIHGEWFDIDPISAAGIDNQFPMYCCGNIGYDPWDRTTV
jgi:hypothetical protein|tara:strand:- start:99 stop:536 length:438 start_codon:yes stop_codon:yes gene_type:complete